MIPRIIHYCWFGKKAKGKLIDDCLLSWKKLLPEYRIIEWNESNYSSDAYFFKDCMDQKKYAFASDYARFDILETHGGIYMDTDMLLIKPLDELLETDCFFGYENDHNISCGVIGCLPGNPFVTMVLKELEAVQSPSFFKGYTIVEVVTAVYKKTGNNSILPKVYPVDFFYPYPYSATGDPLSYKTKNTIAIHLWNATWFNDIQRSQLLYSQGRKKEARMLFARSLLSNPQYIRFFYKYIG